MLLSCNSEAGDIDSNDVENGLKRTNLERDVEAISAQVDAMLQEVVPPARRDESNSDNDDDDDDDDDVEDEVQRLKLSEDMLRQEMEMAPVSFPTFLKSTTSARHSDDSSTKSSSRLSDIASEALSRPAFVRSCCTCYVAVVLIIIALILLCGVTSLSFFMDWFSV